MSWMTWVAVLLAWPLVGLLVAYLFGRFTHRGEAYGNAGELTHPVVRAPVVRHLRRTPTRAAAQTKGRREAAGGRRTH